MAAKESNTKSFVLRIDAQTMEAIEKWAADEFRSTNGQLQWIIPPTDGLDGADGRTVIVFQERIDRSDQR